MKKYSLPLEGTFRTLELSPGTAVSALPVSDFTFFGEAACVFGGGTLEEKDSRSIEESCKSKYVIVGSARINIVKVSKKILDTCFDFGQWQSKRRKIILLRT